MPVRWFEILLERLDRIVGLLQELLRRTPRAVRIVLALPHITYKNGDSTTVPNFALQDDLIYSVPILTQDAEGQSVPAPAGDTFTAVASDPNSLGVAVNGSTLVLTPLVQGATNITVTVTDADGLVAATQVFDITADEKPVNVFLDLSDATTQSQPVPGNPGPGGPAPQAAPAGLSGGTPPPGTKTNAPQSGSTGQATPQGTINT